MNLAIVVVSAEDQIHIRVLHTMLQLNSVVANSNVDCKIIFCNNTPEEKAAVFRDVTTGNFDKTVWLEIDTYIHVKCIADILNEHKNEDFVVFSSMEKKVDWEQFKKFTKEENEHTEPLSMRGIKTDLIFNYNNKSEPGELLPIQQSDLRAFVMSNKKVNRKLKNKFKNTKFFYNSREINGKFLNPAHNLCRMMKEAGVQMKVLVDADVTRYFKHEHVGSVMDTLGTEVRNRPEVPSPSE